MLTLEGVHVYYGDSHVLRGIDVDLQAGQATGLLGRNGMGKTTLIKTLMGYLRPKSGRVLADGRDVTGWPPEKMARLGIGYVPEGRGIFPNLNVRENLVMSERSGLDGRKSWTLERVLQTFPRLSERLNHGGQQLSGGEQQMLSIGRALMTNPRLLILDEATEGLAPLVVEEIWRVIATIRTTGIAILIVDRDWQKVLRETDAALLVQKGEIVMRGASTEMVEDRQQLGQFLGI